MLTVLMAAFLTLSQGQKPPDDFAFRLEYGMCTTDVLDTFQSVFVRDMGGRVTMTPSEVKERLTASAGRRVRVTFTDGVILAVDIGSIDDEGFVHSGPEGSDPDLYWTRFESVISVEPNEA